MEIWNSWRCSWINNHINDFSDDIEKKSYISNWVANYEISDWIKMNNDPNIAFIRIVGLEDEDKVLHEEGIRYKEEAPFRENYSIFIDDPFLKNNENNNSFWTPENWIENHFALPFSERAKVFIADVSGHFVVFKPVLFLMNDGSKTPLLLLINSFKQNTLPNYVASAFFDLYFLKECTLTRK